MRSVLGTPGGVILQDIGPDGRLLLCRDTARSYIFVRRPGDAADRDVSWFDQGLASDLSPDGKILAFTEQSEEAGPSYAACIRDLSGNAPVRLGSGNCAGLSPDGRYVLAEDPDTAVITALPTGPGEPHRIPTPPDLHRQGPARWLPAGSGIVIFGRQNNRTVGYVIDFPSGATRAIAAAAPMQQPGEAVPTLDGRAAVVTDYTTGNLLFVPFDAAQPRPVPGAKPFDRGVQWADAKTLYVRSGRTSPAVVDLLDVTTGQRRPWKTLGAGDRAGQITMYGMAISRDGSTYAYDSFQELTDLFLVDGLK